MLKYFYIAFVILLIWIVSLVNKILPVPLFYKQEHAINLNWEKTKPFENADTTSYAFIYLIMQKHYNKPAYQNIPGGLYYRDDNGPEQYCFSLMYSSDSIITSAGRFGLALIYKKSEQYELVLDQLQRVTITDKPYYNCELGWAQAYSGQLRKAINSFEKELTYKNGNKSSAYKGLAETLFATGNYDAIHTLMAEPIFVKNCPSYVLRNEYFLNGPFLTYCINALKLNGTCDLIVAAILIALLWGYYYTRFKLFEQKDYLLYVSIFLISCIVTPFCIIPYDVLHNVFHIYNDGDVMSTVLYYILGVGIIEEITKSLPVIICLFLFSKRIKEPVDYLLLATISALGFATMENMMYFDLYFGNQNYDVIHNRVVISVIMHIFCSTIIWFGFMKTKLLKNIKYVLICFLLSISAHGLYDVFLSQNSSAEFYILSFPMVIFSFFALKMFYNSALNQSPSFDFRIEYASAEHSLILVASLGMIFIFEFVLDAIRFGAPHANDSLLSSLLVYTVIVLLYSSNFARIVLSNKHWVRIRDFFASNYSPNRTVGSEVVFIATNKSTHPTIFPLYGKIIGLQSYDGIAENYLIKLDTALMYNNNPIYTVMAGFIAKGKERNEIYVKLLCENNVYALNEKGEIEDTNFFRLDYALMETAEDKQSLIYYSKRNWKWVLGIVTAFVVFLYSFSSFMNYTTSIDYYRAALRSLENSNVGNASKLSNIALDFNENNYEARILLAKIRMDGGFYPDALSYLTMENIPEYIAPDYYAIKGLSYYKLHQFKKATESFNECEKYPIHFDSLYWYQSASYKLTANIPKAIKSMNLFLADKNHASKYAYIEMGDLYFSQKLYSKAYIYYDKLVQSKDFYAQALLKRGLCNHYLNKPEDACVDLETAHSYEDPKAIDYLNQWCRIQVPEEPIETFSP
jgi:RsiW-degrading membrane proteinase PrsW (M82 family)